MTALTYHELKSYQRQHRETWPESLALRVHRSLSWLHKAEQSDDLDSQFVFLWIGFNAAYASQDLRDDGFTEKATFKQFLLALIELDTHKALSDMVWKTFPQAIRVLLDNPYIYQPFWDQQGLPNPDWQTGFEAEKQRAHQLLARGDTAGVISVVLGRLYTLRNQILHGGATWNSAVNRDQLRDAVNILKLLLPTLIHLMMINPHHVWSKPMYPVVKG